MESLYGYAWDDKHNGKHDKDGEYHFQLVETDREFTYDENGRLLSSREQEENSGLATYEYTYDAVGNRLSYVKKIRTTKHPNKTDVAESAFYQYNDSNQLVSAKLFDGKKNTTVTYTYDDNGNLISEIGAYGTDQVETYYDYTVENRLQAVYDGDRLLMAAAYDGDGNRVFQLNYNLHTDEDWKDNSGNGNGNNKDNAGSGNNGNGNDSSGNNSNNGNSGNNGNGNGNGNNKENSKSEGTDDAGYGNATNGEEHNSQNQSGILFPVAGEISQTETDLIAMIKTTGKEKDYELIEYILNVNTQYTQVLMELNENGVMDAAYTYGTSRLTEDRFTGESNFYLYDPSGNVAGITDQDGYLWQSYRYDAFGNATFGNPQYDNEYTFNAESYNPNIHSQYLRARYYDTVKGSFLTEDPYLGDIRNPLTLNRYSYCIGNPLFYSNPSGHVITSHKVTDNGRKIIADDFFDDMNGVEGMERIRLHEYQLYESYQERLYFYDALNWTEEWDQMGYSEEGRRISYIVDYDFNSTEEKRALKKALEIAESKRYVTLGMLSACGKVDDDDKFTGWAFREVKDYDLDSQIPTYKNKRSLTQSDVIELNRVLNKYGINTPNRIAHFLAQCEVESQSGSTPVEKYDGDDIFAYFQEKYETEKKIKELGNTEEHDGTKYRGAGAIQITGRFAYTAFSEYMGDDKILSEGALYVAENYYWESAGFYWSIYKPKSSGYDLNQMCDDNKSVKDITEKVNGGDSKLRDRERAYLRYLDMLGI